MMKEKYERTDMDIIRFQTEDVIMTSTEDPDAQYQMPIQ